MGRTVYYAAMTLDGYIAEGDNTIEWLTSYEGHQPGAAVEPVEGGYQSFYEQVGALVMGSVTYEWILGHMEGSGEWPYPEKPCWVLSSRDLQIPEAEGIDVRIVSGAVPELFDEMAPSAGDQLLWVVGGGNVASQFADAGVLDEVRVTVVPVVIADGKQLFDRRLLGGPMRLSGVFPRSNGMVELSYEVVR